MTDETYAINCQTCRFSDRSSTFYRCVICDETRSPADEYPRWCRPVQRDTDTQPER